MRHLLLLLIAFLITTTPNLSSRAYAQMDSLLYNASQTVQIIPEDKGELRVCIDFMPFLRNNEYKSKLVKGYTLPGIWMDPTLSYQPLRNLKIEQEPMHYTFGEHTNTPISITANLLIGKDMPHKMGFIAFRSFAPIYN